MENNKVTKSALDDLESREYREQKNENPTQPESAGIQEQSRSFDLVQPRSLGKASGYGDTEDDFGFAPGYVEIYSENFPTKGIFYAKDSRFLIRAASVNEIKQFSTINEEDPYSVDEALNQILKSCLTYREGSSMRSYKDLKEEDRIYVILAIRELTFVKGENKLTITTNCKDCGHENHIDITKDSFESNEPDPKLMKYYNEDTRRFDVQTKSNGIVSIQAPAVGVMMEVTKYMQKQQLEGKKLDRAFVKTLPYMVSDWRGLNERIISNLQMDFMSWDAKQFQIMNALIEMCTVGVKETVTTICENTKCQVEVTTPISFPNGIKSLFVISDIDSELL